MSGGETVIREQTNGFFQRDEGFIQAFHFEA
jgi:hypothetical protein